MAAEKCSSSSRMNASATKNSAFGADTMPSCRASTVSASCHTARPRITTELNSHSSA